MLRPIPVQHYLTAARARGLTEADLFEGTSIDASKLADPEYLVSHVDYHTFLSNIVTQSGVASIGLDIGLNNEAAHFGILAYSGLSCRNIRRGMEDVWSRYGSTFGVTSRLTILGDEADTTLIEILAPRPSEAVYRFSIEEALCVLLKIGGSLTELAPPFERLQFAYEEPPYATRYRQIFNCPIEFGAPATIVAIKRNWLECPIKTTDEELYRVCREHLERVLLQTEAASPTTLRLRHYLINRIEQPPTLEAVARDFGSSARSLARQLSKEGYTYRQLTEEVRRDLAINWLRTSRVSTKEISYRLGFNEVSSFRRAFKEWTGQTVSEYGRHSPARQRGGTATQGGRWTCSRHDLGANVDDSHSPIATQASINRHRVESR